MEGGREKRSEGRGLVYRVVGEHGGEEKKIYRHGKQHRFLFCPVGMRLKETAVVIVPQIAHELKKEITVLKLDALLQKENSVVAQRRVQTRQLRVRGEWGANRRNAVVVEQLPQHETELVKRFGILPITGHRLEEFHPQGGAEHELDVLVFHFPQLASWLGEMGVIHESSVRAVPPVKKRRSGAGFFCVEEKAGREIGLRGVKGV